MLHLVTQSKVASDATEKEGSAGKGEIALSGSMTRQVRLLYLFAHTVALRIPVF